MKLKEAISLREEKLLERDVQTQWQPRQVGDGVQRVNSNRVDNGSQWLLMEWPSLADLALNPKPLSQPDDHGRLHALGASVSSFLTGCVVLVERTQ